MKTRILNLAMVAFIFVMSASGCASIKMPSSLKSTKLAKARNADNVVIVIGKQEQLAELFQLVRQTGPEAAALANLSTLQPKSEDVTKATAGYSKELVPRLKVPAVGLLDVDRHTSKNAPLKQDSEPNRAAIRPERQVSWNQLAEFSDSDFEPKHTVGLIPATPRLPKVNRQDDIDDVTQQIREIEEEISIRKANLEKLQESSRLAEIVEREQVTKREKLARLRVVNKRLESAEREELATRLKFAERDMSIAKRLELDERKVSAERDRAAKLDPMSAIAKLIEENKRIKKKTNQPAQ